MESMIQRFLVFSSFSVSLCTLKLQRKSCINDEQTLQMSYNYTRNTKYRLGATKSPFSFRQPAFEKTVRTEHRNWSTVQFVALCFLSTIVEILWTCRSIQYSPERESRSGKSQKLHYIRILRRLLARALDSPIPSPLTIFSLVSKTPMLPFSPSAGIPANVLRAWTSQAVLRARG